jgi:hypothetical protein
MGVLPLLLLGCAGAARPASAPPSSPTIRVSPLVVTRDEVQSVEELLAKGTSAWERGDTTLALRLLERCRAGSPPSDIAARATYLSGMAHDRAGQLETAFERFGEVATRWPEHPVARDAALRQIRVGAHLARWSVVKVAAESFLAMRTNLRPLEEITLRGALALALLDASNVQAAEIQVGRAMNVVEQAGLDVPGQISVDLARLYYARGETLRTRADQITFVPLPADFAATLERRCQFVLSAQDAYSAAMRAYDAHWSIVAGYQVSALYARLHADIMEIPVPSQVKSEEQRRLFRAAMTLRYAVLLRKALTMIEHCLDAALRTGDGEGWVARLSASRDSLQQGLREQEASLASVPYTRDQIEAAFAVLTAEASAGASPSTEAAPSFPGLLSPQAQPL